MLLKTPRYSLSYIKYDIKYFLANCKYYRRLKFHRANKKNILYFIFKPDCKHPGLADRLKAIIVLYNLAKANGYEFKFYYETPFCLFDYLKPNKNCRLASLSELEYSLYDTRIINERSWRKITKLTPRKQYHCYNYAGNDIPFKFEDTGYKWSNLFWELFKPSDTLVKAIGDLDIPSERKYISVHLRFVNALEKFENTFFDNHLETQEEREALIEKCKNGIKEIIYDTPPDIPIYVFSDSKVFLDSLTDIPVKVLKHDTIGHTGENASTDIQLKTFIDLYFMSQSKVIYRIKARELYNWSCFALLAARMNDTPFIDKDID